MGTMSISGSVGDEPEDIVLGGGGTVVGDWNLIVNAGVSRDDCIDVLKTMLRRIESSGTDDPPTAYT